MGLASIAFGTWSGADARTLERSTEEELFGLVICAQGDGNAGRHWPGVRLGLHHLIRTVWCVALGLLLLVAAGCKGVAKATGRFAVGTLTSGGSVVAGAQNATVGAAIDVVTDPKSEAAEIAAPKIVTLYSMGAGVQKVIPWRRGLTVYSVRRTARMTGTIGKCSIERGDEIIKSTFKTVLEPGDVLRFHAP